VTSTVLLAATVKSHSVTSGSVSCRVICCYQADSSKQGRVYVFAGVVSL
jgi:hypothetical protein